MYHEMKLFYVVKQYDSIQGKHIEFASGPFKDWFEANQVKDELEDLRCTNMWSYEIACQTIEVQV